MLRKLLILAPGLLLLAACGGGGGGSGGGAAPPAQGGFADTGVGPVIADTSNTGEPIPLNRVNFDFTGTDNTSQPQPGSN